jgi:hypothetical protein
MPESGTRSDDDGQLRAELSARIAFQEGIIRTWSSSGSRPAAVEPTARSHSGFAWFDIAVCRLMLGEASAAGEAFARSAELMHSSLEVMTTPSLATYTAALEAAVLSGDRALESRLAADPVPSEPRPALVGDRLVWALSLPALVRGDDDRVRIQLESIPAPPEKKAWYPGLTDALGAVASRDRPRLTAALQQILAKHAAYARAKSSWCYNSGPCLLCIPAVVLARIADRRGLVLGEITGRTAAIPLALVHSKPGGIVEIEADFLPAALAKA